jgi:signal transduction histidine kinase
LSIIALLQPKNLAQQMMVVMTLSLSLLLTTFFVVDILQQKNLPETASSAAQLTKLSSIMTIVELLNDAQQKQFQDKYSSCHEGYLITEKPFQSTEFDSNTDKLEQRISQFLSLNKSHVTVSLATFGQNDFAYQKCASSINFPLNGMVISLLLKNGKWLNAEVHMHEWHLRESHSWLLWATLAFMIISGMSIKLISYLTQPLAQLNNAAQKFAKGLEFSEVRESGSLDLRQSIKSFNLMQKEVINALKSKTTTLAAISHDIRTPLTALRIKAELLDDEQTRLSFVDSISKIDKITASGLDFLKGDNKTEITKKINLSAMLESECIAFAELNYPVSFIGPDNINVKCRPFGFSRAIRNLIENAMKYGKSAQVNLSVQPQYILIEVIDSGPGIDEAELVNVLEPFHRLSKARESSQGGFGLGLAIVKKIIEGHGGEFWLENIKPHGLKAIIRLPC